MIDKRLAFGDRTYRLLGITLYVYVTDMILSDATIKDLITNGGIKLETPDDMVDQILANIECASFDLRLGNDFVIYQTDSNQTINPFEEQTLECVDEMSVPDDEDFILEPGMFVLGATKERIGLPSNIVGRVEGRSSLARLGILVHITGGFIDPGFGWETPSTITLEIKNINHVPIVLRPGMRVCQLAFELMDKDAAIPYHKRPRSKYNGQIKPTASRFWKGE